MGGSGYILRVERERYRRGSFAILEGRLLAGEGLPLGERVAVLGQELAPGPEGLLWLEGRLERHPRHGLRLRALRAAPLGLEELFFQGGVRLFLIPFLELLAEAGHTAPPVELLREAMGLGEEEAYRLLAAASSSGLVRTERGRVGLLERFRQEEALLLAVRRLLQPSSLRLEPPWGHGLTEEQLGLFSLLSRARLALLTGGPGTGKSHTVGRLLASPGLAGLRVALAAPTGKAAKRLAQLSGRPASTVHRLLEVVPDGQGGFRFRHGPSRPLPYHLVVVDESSMLDVPTALALFQAAGPSTALLLVGDKDQLPPVGPGQPFADLLGRVPTLALTRLFRQAAGNPLVRAARAVLEGSEPLEAPPDPRFRLRLLPEEELPRAVLREAEEADVVLTPTNGGPVGVVRLNLLLRERRNPAPPAARVAMGLPVGPGDPVVFLRNDYELMVANGESGRVLGLSSQGELLVDTGEEVVRLPAEKWSQVLPAYAMSVHRSQGSEWPRVLLVLSRSQAPLLSRELVYTALTRAKERAVLLASPEALYLARSRRAGRRFTWLQVL